MKTKYRVTFEFIPESDPSEWYWKELLARVESSEDIIDWDTFTLEKEAGWTEVEVDKT